jgi:hypothetical protein
MASETELCSGFFLILHPLLKTSQSVACLHNNPVPKRDDTKVWNVEHFYNFALKNK